MISAPLVELVIYRGLPASGKTTLAKAYVAADPENRARVNRDDLRAMLHGGYVDPNVEGRVRLARDALIAAYLEAGVSVASDDTNLPDEAVADLKAIAERVGAHVRVSDLRLMNVELCVLRDWERGDEAVGEDVIRKMHDRYIVGEGSSRPAA